MKRDPSLRHLPQSETNGVPSWTANRWILVGTWAACCVLLMVLLLTEAQFLPAVTAKGVHRVVAAADVSRYFKLNSNTVRSSQQQSDISQANATQNATSVDLHQLWGALPFTPVLRENFTAYEYEYEGQDDAGQHQVYGDAPGPAAVPQYMLAPLERPDLSNPKQEDLAFMAALVAEIIDLRGTPDEGKAGFMRAFKGTKPPADSPWHIRSPLATNWRHKQQKGEEYRDDNGDKSSSRSSRGIKGSSSSSSSNNNVPASSNHKQQQQLLAEQERSTHATSAAEELMSYALRLLTDSNRLATCGTEDDSLPPPPVETAGGPPGGRVLLAATVQDNEAAMPNFVLQVVMFALQAVPGSLFVSIFESGSRDQTVFWLDVLKLLLVPLRVPAMITTNGSLNIEPGASSVECQACMRNMAIDKFFPPAGSVNCPSSSSSSSTNIVPDGSSSSDSGNNDSIARDLLTNNTTAYSTVGRAAQQLQPGRQYMVLPRQQRQQQPQQLGQQLQKISRKLVGTHLPAAAAVLQEAAPTFAAAAGPFDVLGDPTMSSNGSSDIFNKYNNMIDGAAAAAEAQAVSWSFMYQNPDTFYGSSSSNGTITTAVDLILPDSRDILDFTATTTNSSSSSKTAEAMELGKHDTHSSSSSIGSTSSSTMTASSVGATVSQLAPCFKPDWVMFIDSGVFFCKSDLHRLLMHKSADVACGLNLKLAEPAVHSAGSIVGDTSSSAVGSTSHGLNLKLAEPAVHNAGSISNGAESGLVGGASSSAAGSTSSALSLTFLEPVVHNTSSTAISSTVGGTRSSTVGSEASSGTTSETTVDGTSSSTTSSTVGSKSSSTTSNTSSSKFEAAGGSNTTGRTALDAEAPVAIAAAAESDSVGKRLVGITTALNTGHMAGGAAADASVNGLHLSKGVLEPRQQQQQLHYLRAQDAVSEAHKEQALQHQQQQSSAQQQQLWLKDVLLSSGRRQQQQQQDVLVEVLSAQDLQAITAPQQQQQQHYVQSDGVQPLQSADRVEQQQQQLLLNQQATKQLAGTPGHSSASDGGSSSSSNGDSSSSSSSSSVSLSPLPALPVNPTLAKHPFYYGDYGVGRMVTGSLLDAVPPYAGAHMATVRRMSAGLPVQVYCCWNGLAKLRAEPFRRGLRLRASMDTECKTSDKALLCDDFHRLGFSKALVDSGVLVTHQLELSARISNTIKHSKRMPYIRRSRWVEVQGGGSPWLRNELQLRQQTYPALICCDSQDASREVNEHQVLNGTYSSAGGAGESKNQVLGCDQGLGSGFSMKYEELVSGAADGWRIGSDATGKQQCQAVRPLANNHTGLFLQQRQQLLHGAG